MIKECKSCHKDFEAKRKDKKFCSDACRFDAWALNNRKKETVATVATDNSLEENHSVDPLIGPTNRIVDLLTDVRDEQRKTREATERIENMLNNQATAPQMGAARDNSLDEDVEIEIKQVVLNVDAGANLIKGMCALAGADANDYFAAKPKGNGGPKQMDVPQFAPPSFDDDDDIDITVH